MKFLQKRKDLVCMLLVCIMLMVSCGCGGRTAYPIQQVQSGDYNMNCSSIRMSMSNIYSQIQSKKGVVSKNSNTNTAEFAVGMLLFWPALFFMDLSEADRTELKALESRYNHLQRIYSSKGCN